MQEIKMKNGKTIKCFIDIDKIDPAALEQISEAMEQDFVISASIMPDIHKGYTLPIGSVVSCKNVIVPAYVGYDIGCGLASVKTTLKKVDMINLEELHKLIHKRVPVGRNHHYSGLSAWSGLCKFKHTNIAEDIYQKRKSRRQLGTLGGGNHFIEIGYDEDDFIWITVHSGSRGLGHGIASHYMTLASNGNVNKEGHYGFDVDSENGKNYIDDLEFALQYAIGNRKKMLDLVLQCIEDLYKFYFTTSTFINRNHNHAELVKDCNGNDIWIHRKGATHAENNMLGVIPANMKDGVFIVKGKGNKDSMCSSSHGAGRNMGRFKAKKLLKMEDFTEEMKGIVGDITEDTLDESPRAYKNIFDVLDNQTDLIDVLHHIKPLLNVKG